MEVRFADDDLERVATDVGFSGGLTRDIVKVFRRRIQAIVAAKDRRDLYALKGMRLEKLKGARKSEHSIRLNDQQRLIIEFEEGEQGERILVKGIEDYH